MDDSTGGFIPLPTFTEERGSLTAVDFAENSPFPVSRIFYIYGVPAGFKRGEHATRSPEFLICLSGSCRLRIHNGQQETAVTLSSPREGYYIPPLTWRTLDSFSEDCLLLCFSDRPYDAGECITDFNDFLALKRGTRPG